MSRTLPVVTALLLSSTLLGCDKHERRCNLIERQVGTHEGFYAPGDAGYADWGFPLETPPQPRVRRSWTSLSLEEQRRVLDAFVALKQVKVGSGDPGSERADYTSLCSELGLEPYERNLYDYYVEAHTNAFLSMGTDAEPHHAMSHMGPQFLPWHRYLLLRVEADMAEILGDPEFAMPYWDWEDCQEGELCELVFNEDAMGGPGSCEDEGKDVTGYLADQGFQVNIQTDWDAISFKINSIVCEPRPLRREVGCSELAPLPASAEQTQGIFDRYVYDDAPYNSCDTEEDVSFRQYLEGYTNDDTVITCVGAGCQMHSAGHIYIGGDMFHSSASPNDPMFFLHHANVDRLWAAWQQRNLDMGGEMAVDHGNPGYPEMWRGSMFVWEDVHAEDVFDYEALGYVYEALPEEG
ncbi:MAG: tyrosinase family protein [Alphaproteobacteria bacterium]|nr:tyrosinase family protein [Alphaproteobacteria bacterium]MCB9796068.1 tyrosinase family protein [Alphaproteobacteria bacterium]